MATHSSILAWAIPRTEEPEKAFPSSSAVKNLPAVEEAWVQSLGWEAPLEKEAATYSGILAWEIPRTEEPGKLQSMGSQRNYTRLSD